MKKQLYNNLKKSTIKHIPDGKKNNGNINNKILENLLPEDIFIINNLLDPLFIKDDKHRWMFLNKAMCDFIGETSENVIGKTDFDLFKEEEAEVFREIDNMVLKTGKENINEEKFTDNKGVENYLKTHKRLITDKNGNKFILGSVLNITELVNAREAEKQYLKNMEFLSRTAMEFVELPVEEDIYEFVAYKMKELLGDAIIIISAYNKTDNSVRIKTIAGNDEDIKIINKELGTDPKNINFQMPSFIYKELLKGHLGSEINGLWELSGFNLDEEFCKNIEEKLNLKYFHAIGLVYKNMIAGSAAFFLKHPLPPLKKEVIEAFTRQASVVIQKNQLSKQLRTSELKYRTIFENILNVYVELDIDGAIIEMSPSVKLYTSYDRTELIGRNFKDLFANKTDGDIFLEEVFKQEMLRDYEIKINDKQGKVHTCLINIRTEHGRKGNKVKTTGIINDISDRKRNEEKIKKSLKEKDVLLSEIHHRVKNNMQIIVSLINMHIKEIKDAIVADELKDLKNRVLTMSMVHENIYMAENLSEIEFSYFLQKLSRNLLSNYNDSNNISLHFNVSETFLNIERAIPCGLVANELVSNAIKYAFPDYWREKNNTKATISITFKKLKNNYSLIIKDNGIGLPEGLSLNKPKTMGLNLVDILINGQIRGNIEVKVDKGTTFKVTFPCFEK